MVRRMGGRKGGMGGVPQRTQTTNKVSVKSFSRGADVPLNCNLSISIKHTAQALGDICNKMLPLPCAPCVLWLYDDYIHRFIWMYKQFRNLGKALCCVPRWCNTRIHTRSNKHTRFHTQLGCRRPYARRATYATRAACRTTAESAESVKKHISNIKLVHRWRYVLRVENQCQYDLIAVKLFNAMAWGADCGVCLNRFFVVDYCTLKYTFKFQPKFLLLLKRVLRRKRI